MINKFTTREVVLLTVFGTLWGAIEITLGSLLHGLHLPLNGMILAAVGVVIALIGRLFVPKRGGTLYIGVITVILKLFSIGSVIVGPIIGILAEAIVLEIALSLARKPSRIVFLVAGMLAVAWTMLQPFVTGLLIFGRDLFAVWLDLLDTGSRVLGFDESAALWIVLALLLLHLAAGAAGGWMAWEAGLSLRERLGKPDLAQAQ